MTVFSLKCASIAFAAYSCSCIQSYAEGIREPSECLPEINVSKGMESRSVQMLRGLVLVPLSIGSVDNQHFLLDTGAIPISALDTGVAERVITDLERSANANTRNLSNKKGLSYQKSVLANGSFGDLKLPDLDVALIDLSSASKALDLKISGILGANFFENYIVRVDYCNKTVSLFNDFEVFESAISSGRDLFQQVFYSDSGYLPFPTVQVNIGGDTVLLMIDSGAESGLRIFSHAADRLNLDEMLRKKKANFETVIGRVSRIEGKIPKIRIGPYDFDNVNTSILDERSFIPFLDGYVGVEIFQDFTLSFDYKNQLTYFEKH